MVTDIDEQLRQGDIAVRERSIKCLTARLKKNTVGELGEPALDLAELGRDSSGYAFNRTDKHRREEIVYGR